MCQPALVVAGGAPTHVCRRLSPPIPLRLPMSRHDSRLLPVSPRCVCFMDVPSACVWMCVCNVCLCLSLGVCVCWMGGCMLVGVYGVCVFLSDAGEASHDHRCQQCSLDSP